MSDAKCKILYRFESINLFDRICISLHLNVAKLDLEGEKYIEGELIDDVLLCDANKEFTKTKPQPIYICSTDRVRTTCNEIWDKQVAMDCVLSVMYMAIHHSLYAMFLCFQDSI